MPGELKALFLHSKLVLKFFTARLRGVNLLFLYKMARREKGPLGFESRSPPKTLLNGACLRIMTNVNKRPGVIFYNDYC